MKIYDCSSTEDFINRMIARGYEAIQLSEGTLGVGDSAKLDFANKIRRMEVRHNYVSDWGKVKQFIEDHGYIPERCTLDDYITCMLLHLDGFSEDEGREITVNEFLECFDEYGTFSDYDY